MADTQRSADITSSQGTYVPVREARPPPSGQDAKTGTIDRLNNDRSQGLAGDASADVFTNDTKPNGQESSFTDILEQYRDELNHDFDGYEQNLHKTNPAERAIAEFDWDELELDYQKQVGEVAMKEKEIMIQFDARFKQFMLWMQVSDERESQRAIKRLKTQSAYVQISEADLAQKELHYSNVMQAFQNAMSLLNHPS